MKRKVIEIKKAILKELKNGELSLKALEIKVNTGSQTIQNQIEELKFFRCIDLIKYKRNEKTGRPCTNIQITSFGKSLI